MITYYVKNGKYIFCKDEVYFSLTQEQAKEMLELLTEILK